MWEGLYEHTDNLLIPGRTIYATIILHSASSLLGSKGRRDMALGKHKKTSKGRFRKEKQTTKIQNLKKTYPILNDVNGNMHLGTLLDRLGVDSLSQALKKLRGSK